MLKLIHPPFILIGFFALFSLPCFGSDLIEGSSSVKRPRSPSYESTSDTPPAPPDKKQKIAPFSLPFNAPKKEDAIFTIAHYARIRDGLALLLTCRKFAALLNQDRLWEEYVGRIPGHYAFRREKADGFYKALFRRLLRPQFFPLSAQSKDIYIDIQALSSLNLFLFGSSKPPAIEDQQENNFEKKPENISEATIENDESDSQESDSLEGYEDVFEQAIMWQEGTLSFVPTFKEASGNCVLSTSRDDNILVGTYNDVSPTHFKAASWTLGSLGQYEMSALPDDEALESIARAVNHDGTKIIGSLYSPRSKAVLWENNVLSYLETPEGTISSVALSLNKEGDRIVGYIENAFNQIFPALWLNKRLIHLPLSPYNLRNPTACLINANGTLIAGYVTMTLPTTKSVTQQLVLWTVNSSDASDRVVEKDHLIFIPSLLLPTNEHSYQSFPRAINDSGDRMVGYEIFYYPPKDNDSGEGKYAQHAVIWERQEDNEFKSYFLQGLIGLDLSKENHLKEATCIDATGTIIAGNGDSGAWCAYFPHYSTLIDEGLPLSVLLPEYVKQKPSES